MERNTGFALILAIATVFFLFGCLQQSEMGEEVGAEERGEPPCAYNPLSYMYDELVSPPEGYEEIYGCSPPEISDFCEGQTRYYDFECVDGEWKYKMQECAYECREGACINTGCPSCADGDPCTLDFCSNAANAECVHVPIAGCGTVVPEGVKACKPVGGPGSYIVIDVYPAGAPPDWTDPIMSQKLAPGQKMWIDEDDSIYFDSVYLEGSCPQCYYEPVLKFPPSVKLITTHDLAGEMGTYLKNEGEMGYMCIEGQCKKPIVGHCLDYVCGTSIRFVVSEMNISLECS